MQTPRKDLRILSASVNSMYMPRTNLYCIVRSNLKFPNIDDIFTVGKTKRETAVNFLSGAS